MVRNPLDSLYSLFNMIQTSSHNESIAKDVHDLALKSSIWDDFIVQETTVWRDFHNYWLRSDLPIETYFVTYESLLESPKQTLSGLFQYLLSVPSIEGMAIASRIDNLCKQQIESGGPKTVYKPRSGKINVNNDFFSQA